eukprot:XP_001695826.1 predicted protein [Chlamydomonas reinhardtii]
MTECSMHCYAWYWIAAWARGVAARQLGSCFVVHLTCWLLHQTACARTPGRLRPRARGDAFSIYAQTQGIIMHCSPSARPRAAASQQQARSGPAPAATPAAAAATPPPPPPPAQQMAIRPSRWNG